MSRSHRLTRRALRGALVSTFTAAFSAVLAIGCGSDLDEGAGGTSGTGGDSSMGGSGQGADDSGGSGGEIVPIETGDVPVDFSLLDENTTSITAGEGVSPRDYLETVSGWYFGHAT